MGVCSDEILDRCFAFTRMLKDRFSYIQDRNLSTRLITDAHVTLRTYDEKNGTFTGAVYDKKGRLQQDTLRYNKADIVPIDEATIDCGATNWPISIETAFYGGLLHPALGHTIFETLGRFWFPALFGQTNENVVYLFHHWPGLDLDAFFLNPLFKSLFGSVGVTRQNARLVDQNTKVKHLLLPDRAAIYHDFIHPVMGDLLGRWCQQIAPYSAPQTSSIFLSRTKWLTNKRVANEQLIDAIFENLGFSVIYPEELPPNELLPILRSAKTVAAVDGSHAHLFCFCLPNTNSIMLDTRIVPTQIALEQLSKLRSIHIPLLELANLFSAETLEIKDTTALKALIERILSILTIGHTVEALDIIVSSPQNES
jgi:hypothetical protein